METQAPPTTRQVAEAVFLDPEQRKRLFSYAWSRFEIGPEDAQDLLQETALELLRQRSLVQSPNGFVFNVFHLRCCRFLKRSQAHREIFAGGEAIAETTPCPFGPEKMDRQVALRQALAEISASCRKLLLAYYVEGRSLREAAETTAVAYSGIWKTISRCLKRLRKCLD